MFLSRTVCLFRPLPAGLAIAVAAMVLLAQSAAAQQYRPIPPDAKGYQIAQLTQQNLQRQAAARSTAEAPGRAVPAPYYRVESETPSPRVVTFEMPDGSVRTFVLEGSIRTAPARYPLVRLTSK